MSRLFPIDIVGIILKTNFQYEEYVLTPLRQILHIEEILKSALPYQDTALDTDPAKPVAIARDSPFSLGRTSMCPKQLPGKDCS